MHTDIHLNVGRTMLPPMRVCNIHSNTKQPVIKLTALLSTVVYTHLLLTL